MRIGVDLDQTIGDFLSPLIAHHNEAYGTQLEIEHFHSFYFPDVWGGTGEETHEKLNRFYETDHFGSMPPFPEAQHALRLLRDEHELILITSRGQFLHGPTKKWIEEHFPNTFSEIILTNQHEKGPKETKSEVCGRVGIDIMIDDSLEFAQDCARCCTVFLLDAKWNRADSLPQNIVRVRSWAEVLARLIADGD